jgi:hypothetical protein
MKDKGKGGKKPTSGDKFNPFMGKGGKGGKGGKSAKC